MRPVRCPPHPQKLSRHSLTGVSPLGPKANSRSSPIVIRQMSSANNGDGGSTRYDKLAANCLAFVQLASIRLWLHVDEVHALILVRSRALPPRIFHSHAAHLADRRNVQAGRHQDHNDRQHR